MSKFKIGDKVKITKDLCFLINRNKITIAKNSIGKIESIKPTYCRVNFNSYSITANINNENLIILT